MDNKENKRYSEEIERNKLNRIRFFYFALLNFDTVFKTQIIGWVNLYRKEGLDFRIVKFYYVKHIFKFGKLLKDIRGIRQLYTGPLYIFYLFPDRYIAGRYLNLFIYFVLLLSSVVGRKRTIIQTRELGLDKSLKKLKKLFSERIKIIYDARAAAAEEYKYYNEVLSASAQIKYSQIQDYEKNMVRIADKVFTVSNVLKNYLIELESNSKPEKYYLNPCNADSRYFYFDKDERNKQRQILNLGNRLVVVYSGGLEMRWHVPQKVFNAFLKIKGEIPNAYFLVLTNDTIHAEILRNENRISKPDISILSIDNRNVRPYLNASDIGLLIRDNVLMNNVASPTKFAVYLLCGLPVIISPGVGDYSELVEEKKIGLIYSDNTKVQFNQRFSELNLPLSEPTRHSLGKWGVDNFSKQSNLINTIKVYNSLFLF